MIAGMKIANLYFADELRHTLGPAEAAAWLQDTLRRDIKKQQHPREGLGMPKTQSVSSLADSANGDSSPSTQEYPSSMAQARLSERKMQRSASESSMVWLLAQQASEGGVPSHMPEPCPQIGEGLCSRTEDFLN